jgi:ABC-2 type transport system permease protein
VAALAAFFAVFRRTLLKTARRPVSLTFSLVQPLVWMGCFGFLFNRYRVERLNGDTAYLTFLVPGVSAMSILFGASQSGIELIRDLQTGFLQRLLLTPTSRTWILAGKLSADVARLLVQASLIVGLGVLLGARPSPSPLGLLLATVALLSFGVLLASLSCTVALLARSPEGMATYVHLVNMPLLFTSTALVPDRHMPSALAAISSVNPLSLTVNTWRVALVFGELPPLAPLGTLLLLSSAALALASRALRRAVTG